MKMTKGVSNTTSFRKGPVTFSVRLNLIKAFQHLMEAFSGAEEKPEVKKPRRTAKPKSTDS